MHLKFQTSTAVFLWAPLPLYIAALSKHTQYDEAAFTVFIHASVTVVIHSVDWASKRCL